MEKRYFLVAYSTGSSLGSVWFEHAGFPSHAWIKKAIIEKFKLVNTIPAIMNIYEFKNDGDFYSFSSDSTRD